MGDPRRRAVRAAMVALVAAAAGGGLWWSRAPPAPQALYRARCSSCHPLADACRYGPRERGEIVHVMRARHGADAVIDDEEARVISRFMREALRCR